MFKKVPLKDIKTKSQARDIAIAWQHWQSTISLSYAEAAAWQAYFLTIARRFKLTEEFKENCIC